ncbi:hypothetical protein ACVW0V_008969 [Bradyrhizobium elkanii]
MRSRHADERLARRVQAERTQQLGLLAPHDVGRGGIALRDPRQDTDIARLPADPDGAVEDVREMRRRIDIAGLDPALPRARHAADHDRQIGLHTQRIEMRLQHGCKAGPGGRGHAFIAAPLAEHLATGAHQPEPEAAGAPVDRDIGNPAHRALFHALSVRRADGAAARTR